MSEAPRITMQDIENNIASEHYFTAEQGVYGVAAWNADSETKVSSVVFHSPEPLPLLTFCVIVLRNGFTVTGESACVSPENFDAGIGYSIAREKAIDKIWPLMGYALKCKLAEAKE